MDNRAIDVTSEGDSSLEKALELIWPSTPGGKSCAYILDKLSEVTKYYAGQDGATNRHEQHLERSSDGIPTLILLWSDTPSSTKFLYPLSVKEASMFVSGWLKSLDYGLEPDHDGDNGKGWRVFTEGWGHVMGNQYSICAIQPAWAMYGK